MITSEQVKEFLQQYGITAPDFVIDCVVEKVISVEQCMIDAGYSECDIKLIQIYTAAVLLLGQSGVRVDSDRRPSGAARNYANEDFDVIKSSLINNINTLDKNGCVSDLLPAPTDTAFFATVKGC